MKSFSKLLALVGLILIGTAVTVDAYLESRQPGKPHIERAVLTSSPAEEAPQAPVVPRCTKHRCVRDETS